MNEFLWNLVHFVNHSLPTAQRDKAYSMFLQNLCKVYVRNENLNILKWKSSNHSNFESEIVESIPNQNLFKISPANLIKRFKKKWCILVLKTQTAIGSFIGSKLQNLSTFDTRTPGTLTFEACHGLSKHVTFMLCVLCQFFNQNIRIHTFFNL